jgi:hypothetical protein
MTEKWDIEINEKHGNLDVFYKENGKEFINLIEIFYIDSLIYSNGIGKNEQIIIPKQYLEMLSNEKAKYFRDFCNSAYHFIIEFQKNKKKKNSNKYKSFKFLEINIFPTILKTLFNDYLKSLAVNNGLKDNQEIAIYEAIFLYYPKFKQDIKLFLKEKIIEKTPTGFLQWNKSKKSLAEYFAYLAYDYPNKKNSDKNMNWNIIEKTFQLEKLKNHLSSAKQFSKLSLDFKEILKNINHNN